MNIKEELCPLIDTLHRDGVKVYAHVWKEGKEITYVHFVKDNKIGYAQYDRLKGLSFATCHKPCSSCGTGFQVEGSTVNDYKNAFTRPHWACNYTVSPYKDWDDFVSYQHYKNFIEV